MNPTDALQQLIRQLEEAQVPYMIAGSFASTYHGISRTTLDIDVVIDPAPDSLSRRVSALADNGFYVSRPNARDALIHRTQFNVIHMASVWKIDLIIRKDRIFSKVELARGERVTLLDIPIFLASAEDTILTKAPLVNYLVFSGGNYAIRQGERWAHSVLCNRRATRKNGTFSGQDELVCG